MSDEIWKDIDGYVSVYKISNLGRVKSLRDCNHKPREKILSLYDSNGYLQINLVNSGKKRSFKVHRLVAKAFIPNPENKAEVNHIDGNKHNNAVWNLEWNSRQENAKHALNMGLYKPKKNNNRKLTEQEVQEIRKEYIKGQKSARAIANEYGVCEMTIYKILWKKSYTDIE